MATTRIEVVSARRANGAGLFLGTIDCPAGDVGMRSGGEGGGCQSRLFSPLPKILTNVPSAHDPRTAGQLALFRRFVAKLQKRS
jgi:hypothetical protein